MKKDKSRSAGSMIIAVLILMLTLTACGKSEFGVTENTGKRMTISAANAAKDAFFMVGSLEVEEGEQIAINADLAKGTIMVEIVKSAAEQSIDELPDLNAEAVIMATLKATDSTAGTAAAGSYMVRATCLEKATGTIEIDVNPAP